MDTIRNESTGGPAYVEWIGDKVRKTRLRWTCANTKRKRKKRARPQRFVDVAKGSMPRFGETEDDAGG